MKQLIKRILAGGTPWRLSAPLRTPGIVVLTYHRIAMPDDPVPHLDARIFEHHLEWLLKHCEIVAPSELRERAGRKRGPRREVVLTFDDGHVGYSQYVWPLLRDKGVPAVMFIAPGPIDATGELLWFDQVHLSIFKARAQRMPAPWDPTRTIALSDAASRQAVAERTTVHFKHLPDDARRLAVQELSNALELDVAACGRQVMTWDEIRQASDVTEWGGHSYSHPILSLLDDAALEMEIRLTRERIHAETGTSSPLFAYPNGNAGDFDERTRRALQRYGYATAFSTIPGIVDETTEWMAVRRLGVEGPVADLAWQAAWFRMRRYPAWQRAVQAGQMSAMAPVLGL